MKLFYQFMAIFFNFSPTSNHLHPLQVENCDNNSRLVVDEDDNVKSGLKGLNINLTQFKKKLVFDMIKKSIVNVLLNSYLVFKGLILTHQVFVVYC